jgi:Amt family ammonium transporter
VQGIASGAVAGLATPFVALLIGLFAGGLSYAAIMYDDSLVVVAIHGVGGVFGVLATGLFASKGMNVSGADGLFFGNPMLLGVQQMAALSVVGLFAAAVTFGILKLIDRWPGLRVSPEEERMGLDLSQHNERAYS